MILYECAPSTGMRSSEEPPGVGVLKSYQSATDGYGFINGTVKLRSA